MLRINSIFRSRIKLVLLLFVVLFLIHFLSGWLIPSGDVSQFSVSENKDESAQKMVEGKLNKIKNSIRDYSAFIDGLENYAVKAQSLKGKYKTEKAKELFYTHDSFLFSKEYLENVLDIPDSTYEELKQSHQKYVDVHMGKLLEDYGIVTFGNVLPSDPEWKAYEGSAGYVIIGGGKYSWLAYLVVRQIRLTGAKLPIEIFIPSEEEYEKDFCEVLLPQYDARCNLLDKNLADSINYKFGIGGYQFKMLAILLSKFENVLYLDSDNFPTRNVDYLFESDLFKQNGLILWPDAWARTTNPKFYNIADVAITENKVRYSKYDEKQAENEGLPDVKPLASYTFANSNFHDFAGTLPNPTSETGMIIINKSMQVKTLLLAFYYNMLGPDYYYPLLTQGSAGEGDKETFIAAAHVVKNPWYQTIKTFQWTGYVVETTNKFQSKALCHYDPVQSQDQSDGDIDIIFAHLSYPKMFPDWLINDHELIYEESKKHIRMYSSINKNVGYDFDLRIFSLLAEGFCPTYTDKSLDSPQGGYMGEYLRYVRDSDAMREKCDSVFMAHAAWLQSTTEF